MKFTDRAPVGALKETKEGYLIATARVARTGVQEYLASELGDIATSAGFKPNDIVRVLRHEDEVFHKDSLASITRMPVTIDHPSEGVTADNWAQHAVGEMGDSYARDGEWIVVNPFVKDARGVAAAKSTHRELSMGYEAEIVAARDTAIADFEQRNIRHNHVALVPAARAGHAARIGDSAARWGASPITDNEPPPGTPPIPTGGPMTTKTVVLGDKAVQVLAEDAAEVEQYKNACAKTLADANAAHDAAMAAKDAELAKAQAALDDAKTKIMSDADLDKRVAERAALVAKALAIVPDAKVDGLSDADIRKAVVTAKLGDAAIADKSPAYIDARFDILAEDAPASSNPVRDAFNNGIKTADSEMNDSRQAYLDRLSRKTTQEA